MNIPVKHPVQIYIYIFAILFQIFENVSAQRKMMKVQKVQSPFWKPLFFVSRQVLSHWDVRNTSTIAVSTLEAR